MNLILIIPLLILVATVYRLTLRVRLAESKALVSERERQKLQAKFDSEIAAARILVDGLERTVDSLSRWQQVDDADAKATQLVADARQLVTQLLQEATELRVRGQSDAAQLVARASAAALATKRSSDEEVVQLRSAALARLEEATARATSIVESAELKAQEIAGDALRALRDARSLEETVKALRNKVEGYGDRYLVPGISLLDDLAEHFGNLEVGQELKAARDRVKRAVATRRAAACDYVEENRKETAVRFVTDAFNGKVDSILARVKHNNFGQLAQEIRDAYRLVNENGRAFRSARINEDYRDLRLQELKWAVVAHELKLQEREEQRLINEQIREEEKARREIERAMRDASKEEELLRKAMEKATNQLAKASDEQRAKYEGQLAELAARLTEAEEKNQRALSMAQQTRRGHVYIISNLGSFGEHVYKIGLTRRLDPLDRIRELGDSSVPFEFDVHALIFADDAPALEHQLHRHFALHQMNKVNFRKEFFRVELAFIRDELDKLGVSTRWTMLARARDYRESIAIERAIADDPKARTAWLNRQLLLERTIEFARDEEEEAMSPAHYELQAHATSVAT